MYKWEKTNKTNNTVIWKDHVQLVRKQQDKHYSNMESCTNWGGGDKQYGNMERHKNGGTKARQTSKPIIWYTSPVPMKLCASVFTRSKHTLTQTIKKNTHFKMKRTVNKTGL